MSDKEAPMGEIVELELGIEPLWITFINISLLSLELILQIISPGSPQVIQCPGRVALCVK